ncbi:MAG TPA: ATP-binding cassette domain-containing protein [Amycolatopsis sp.]|jgi:ABC-type branched-subunit amino acid transport system ATPase component|nr:ATP-binding cassette domain-containing protein [Amycolatopsis sp.]
MTRQELDRVQLREVRGDTKSFGVVVAVASVSLPLYSAEAHTLVGENGADKSTIIKMLAGVHRPDKRYQRHRTQPGPGHARTPHPPHDHRARAEVAGCPAHRQAKNSIY